MFSSVSLDLNQLKYRVIGIKSKLKKGFCDVIFIEKCGFNLTCILLLRFICKQFKCGCIYLFLAFSLYFLFVDFLLNQLKSCAIVVKTR